MKVLSEKEASKVSGGVGWFVPIFIGAVAGGYKVGSDYANTRNERDKIKGSGIYSGQCSPE